jgi:cytoskeleton protein RodZ
MKEIGILLRETRENLGVGTDAAAKELKMRAHYIEILESGDVSSISKEIYIIGYLKSYASWLGLDSNELVYKFKAGNDDFSVDSKISTKTSSFFSLDEELLSPGKPLLLSCIILVVLSYLIWGKQVGMYNGKQAVFDVDNVVSESKFKGFAYKKGVHKKIILLAKGDVDVKLYYSDNEIIEKKLMAGDMYFFPDERSVLISANVPRDIDILSDDEKNAFFGTLEDYYVVN